ncbi:MAG: methylmalonyl Co-A mutase-associated GTPase MeaB [Desulfobacteraceae bacterium]|nr:methylmalonyl Co-A mutase-associated GTPase MeaB [Desulfobacteraceae bacterium]MBC2756246.1 methylmalonyl Co-A mutase-associated GTPase MeaB [Desulfobacteraceae bacterium]
MDIVDKMFQGDRLALARLLSILENNTPEVPLVMSRIQQNQDNGYYIGFTGAPGSGKSTLVDKMILQIRNNNLEVGVVAIDPTSPFSGGAILGDRIRMQNHALDPGVFIRSLATRGSLGGLSRAAKNTARILNASGKDYCIIETVGVGQVEIDIVDTADTTVVVLMPDTGDSIQAIKAGIMEIADIIVVNKADLKGTDQLIADLMLMLHENQRHSWWQVPVIATQADKNIGIKELFEKIEEHKEVLKDTGMLVAKRKEQRVSEFMEIIEQTLLDVILESQKDDSEFCEIINNVMAGLIDPYSAAKKVFGNENLIKRWMMRLSSEILIERRRVDA